MLRDLDLQPYYRSGKHQLLRDFYEPCLTNATDYARAVGYFTSTSLAAAARGLRPFLDHEGRMRLVASPKLTEEDAAAIRHGYERRDRILEEVLLRELADHQVPDPIRQRLEFLAWLIAEGRLDIKIALVEGNERSVGIYHEKVGIFRDDGDDIVVFTGSANESVGGLIANFEALEVFCSWRLEDAPRVHRWVADFEALWANRTPGLVIYDFPEAAQRQLLDRYRPHGRPGPDPEAIRSPTDVITAARAPFGLPELPPHLALREYQKEAVRAWFAANGRGIWEMATGTGKTITALAATMQVYRRLRDRERALLVIVVCPFQHLVTQWADAAAAFGVRAIRCLGPRQTWMPTLSSAFAAVQAGEIPFALAAVTNYTFGGDAFQAHLMPFRGDLLVIGDEVHNLGSQRLRTALPPQAAYRLGLSATPERHFDADGTVALFDYFGPPVFQLGLRRAIAEGALVPYTYHPVPVPLADDEQAAYVELSTKIARLAGMATELVPEFAEGPLQMALFERARLVGRARAKLDALRQTIAPLRETTHNLVYCAEGGSGSGELSQLDAVVRLLGRDLKMRVNSYTDETTLVDREERRRRFASGDLQALVAIRCLDEGVDIPETRRGFILASTTNPRQFVQRRGRLLRPAPGKRRAALYDFIVVPPDLSNDPKLFAIERRLVGRELARVMELAEAAENGPEALHSLLDLRRRYQLLALGSADAAS
jgi:DNA phosphorothioation system restriction enzyme